MLAVRPWCEIRGPGCTTAATHLDHIIPVSQGGAWFDPSNVRPACRTCNLRRGNRATPAPAEPFRTSRRW
ncbi:MAG: HNH endonuclease [Acidimicrobiales bacterium]